MASGTDVDGGSNADGTYPMGLQASQFSTANTNYNVAFEIVDGWLKISPLTGVTVTITGANNTTDYDGAFHTVTGYTATASSDLYNVNNSFTFTPAGGAHLENNVIAATRKDVGTTYMGLAPGQFNNTNPNFTQVSFVVNDGYQTINPLAGVTVTITGKTDTKPYDGAEHTVTGYTAEANTTLYDVDHDFTFSGTATASRTHVVEGTDTDGQTDMGLAQGQFSNTNTNFSNVSFVVIDGYQKITPITATVTITGANNTTDYDGDEHVVTGYTATANTTLYDVTSDFTFTPATDATLVNGVIAAKRTNAGTTNMGLKGSDAGTANQFANTNTDFSTVTFNVTDGYQTINPIDVTVTITGHNNTADYDGTAHTVTGYNVSISNPLYTVNDFSFTGSVSDSTATRTNVVESGDTDGKTDMGLTNTMFTNTNTNFNQVTFNVTDGYQKIDPIDVTVTIVGANSTLPYDGNEHNVSGYTAMANTALYDVEHDFIFTPAADAVYVNGVIAAKRTNAGTTYMGLKGTSAGTENQFANTNPNFGTVTFVVTDGYQTIDKINVTVTITGHNNTTTFNGEEHVVTGYDVDYSNALYTAADFTFTPATTATLVNGVIAAKRTLAGTTYMGLLPEQFTNTNTTNFDQVDFQVTDGFQTITALDEVVVTITGHNNTTAYDGAEHSVTGYDVSISNPLYTVNDFTFNGTAEATRTNAGTTNMGLKGTAAGAENQFTNTNTNFSNVNFVVIDGYQTINKINATVTIVGANNTTAYDGEAHTVTGYTATSSTNLYKVTGDNIDFTFNGTATASRTNVVEGSDNDGKTDMGLAASQFANTNPNFATVTFNVTDGYQVITPINAAVTIVGANNTAPYDGNEHSVSGYTVTNISTTLYTESDFTFSGTAAAARTNVVEGTDTDGKTDMGLTNTMFTNTNTNFNQVTFNVTDGYQTITPINVEVVITGHTDTKVYNGTEQSVTGYDVSIANTLYHVNDFTFSGDSTAKRKDVGTTNMNLKGTSAGTENQFANVNPNFGTVTFTVTDGWMTITPSDALVITLPSQREKEYDGSALNGSCTASPAYGTATPTMTYSIDGGSTFTSEIPTITDFGTLNVIARASCPNYSSVDSTFTLRITKRSVTLTSANLTKAYDGYSLVNGTTPLAVESGFVTGQGATYTFTASQTNVGFCNNTFEYTLNAGTKAANYEISKSYGTLTVTDNVNPLVIKSNSNTWKYNGEAHTFPSYTVTYNGNPVAHIDGDSTIFRLPTSDTLRITAPASVTHYTTGVSNTFTYTIEHQSFYTNIATDYGVIAIDKRTVTLTSATDSKTYDGTALTNSNVTVGGDGFADGEGATYNVTGSQLNAGSSANTFTYALNSGTLANDYNISTTNGTLTVNPVATLVTVTIRCGAHHDGL